LFSSSSSPLRFSNITLEKDKDNDNDIVMDDEEELSSDENDIAAMEAMEAMDRELRQNLVVDPDDSDDEAFDLGSSSGGGGGSGVLPGMDPDSILRGAEKVKMDYTLIKNFLESYKSQEGRSGPVGNVAGRLGEGFLTSLSSQSSVSSSATGSGSKIGIVSGSVTNTGRSKSGAGSGGLKRGFLNAGSVKGKGK